MKSKTEVIFDLSTIESHYTEELFFQLEDAWFDNYFKHLSPIHSDYDEFPKNSIISYTTHNNITIFFDRATDDTFYLEITK